MPDTCRILQATRKRDFENGNSIYVIREIIDEPIKYVSAVNILSVTFKIKQVFVALHIKYRLI